MATNQIDLSIVTLDGKAFHTRATEVVVNTESGEIAILPNHVPMISIVKAGEIVVSEVDAGKKTYESEQGFLEIRGNSRVIVLVDKIK